MTESLSILSVNAGSSSIKLVLFNARTLERLLEVTVANIGQPDASVMAASSQAQPVRAANHAEALDVALGQLGERLPPERLVAVGHRVVHGGKSFDSPVIVTPEVMGELRKMVAFDPEHLPAELEIIETFARRFPQVPQVACFDTAFYRDLPEVARLLPLPRKFEALGLRRYGFHGLSYEFLLQKFSELAGETAASGRVIMAHLGSGASLTAVKNGRPYDTTMAFTPASGIPMSTRAGDLDPGIVAFLHRETGMSIDEFNHMVHFESGLLGVSGRTADMEVLIREAAHDQQAREAVELFCYQVRKTIGSFAAVLGGVDSIIFTGGMGEHAPVIRKKICDGLGYLGITLHEARNENHEFLISGDGSSAGVHVLHTDEAVVIVNKAQQLVYRNGEG